MRDVTELPPWEGLFKQIVWQQMGDLQGLNMLDFGSGEGVTADHFAQKNTVVAMEPSKDMLANAWRDQDYRQILGDVSALGEFGDGTFDYVICHNVLEYIAHKEPVVSELIRVLKPGGTLSIVKHNRAGRVMQMAVLLDDLESANALLDGTNGHAAQFGTIYYYDDENIIAWNKDIILNNTFGIRTFFDLQQNQEKHRQSDWRDCMMRLEMKVSQIDEFQRIAFFHHLLYTKRHHGGTV